MVKMGVIVPTKVERTALQNAASIAGLLLTTDAIVSEIPEEEEGPGHASGRRHGRGHVLTSLSTSLPTPSPFEGEGWGEGVARGLAG